MHEQSIHTILTNRRQGSCDHRKTKTITNFNFTYFEKKKDKTNIIKPRIQLNL